MTSELLTEFSSQIIYPESDGKPMADNTKQFHWIVVIKENLGLLFADNKDVFIAGDLLWYPVEGNNTICQAPDVMVAFGCPKGDRGSYKQWEENNIAPQVVFEILSPINKLTEMAKKLKFYEKYQVKEYYLYDPEKIDLIGWLRDETSLTIIESINNWISPRLKIRFELKSDTLEIYRPDGNKFLSYLEIAQLAQQQTQRAEQEKQRADEAITQLEQEQQRYQELLERLEAKGINLEHL